MKLNLQILRSAIPSEARDLLFFGRNLVVCVIAPVIAISLAAQAPTAVPIPKEPHHHLVLENDYVRVFRVSVPAHDATLLHQHDVPYLYVSLGPADVINAVQGKPEAHLVMADGQVGYSRGGFAHIARTDAGTSFDNVTIELLKPQGEPRNLCTQIVPGAASIGCDKRLESAAEGRGFSVEPQLETEEMTLDLVHLNRETKSTKIAASARSLLVVLNESEVQVVAQGRPAKTLRGGEVIWIAPGSQASVFNPDKKFSSYLQVSFKDVSGSKKP